MDKGSDLSFSLFKTRHYPRGLVLKVMRSLLVTVSAALLFVAVTGCTSVASLANKKDTVSSIKKLSKMLVKDSSNQEAADVFNELYNREMANKMYIVHYTDENETHNQTTLK